MKIQKFLRPCFAFLLLSTFSILFFGCGAKGESKIQTEEAEGKQLIGKGSINEADVVKVNASDSEVDQFVSPAWHKELACAFYLVFK